MTTLIAQAAIFTTFYSDLISKFVFENDENFAGALLPNLGEANFNIVFSLALLAIPSIFSGFFFKELFIGFGSTIYSDSIFVLPNSAHFFESDYLPVS